MEDRKRKEAQWAEEMEFRTKETERQERANRLKRIEEKPIIGSLVKANL
jgi:hypothetical protein